MQTALKAKHQESCTQFYLTTNIITKLNTFKLTPTAKLVLLYLTTCYNPKHKEVFPKQKTIADKLGVSEISVTRAIQELHKEGLIISERKISNIYIFTPRIVSEQPENLIDDKQQIDSKENIKMIDSYIHEQTKRTNKEQTVINKGGNVYSEDDEILKDYAIKHGARNIDAYINTLKSSKSAEKIICEYKKRKKVTQMALHSVQETQNLLKQYESFKQNVDCPQSVNLWVELGKKFSIQKKL